LELILAVALPRHIPGLHEKFSLVFRSLRDEALPQGIHRLKHSELGEIDLFLAPIMARAGRGLQYEAIINREKDPGASHFLGAKWVAPRSQFQTAVQQQTE